MIVCDNGGLGCETESDNETMEEVVSQGDDSEAKKEHAIEGGVLLMRRILST